ncbi:TonB-dependent receptor [Paremcibacter congregatus]|nr:TonB-dependent receptor [Paremcibacter congregatus]
MLTNNMKKYLILSTVSAVILPCASAASAEKTEDTAVAFEEIIVSASRRDVSLQDTALSVTAVTPADFAVGGLVSLRDIIEYTPGVIYSGGSSPILNTISMRGVSTTISAPTVGIYIDEVPIGSRSGFAAGSAQALDAMQANIERVEVIKGPQGTLYGSSSMGGVIRYITKDPSKNDMSGSAKVDLSTMKEGGITQLYSASLTAPIVEDKLGVNVSGYYKDADGFIDRDVSAATGAAEDVNGYESYGISAKVVANLSDDFSGSFLYLRTKTDFTGENIITLSGPPFVPAQGRYLSEEGASTQTGAFDLFSGNLKYNFSGMTLISSTSYETRSTSGVSDQVAAYGPLVALFAGVSPDVITSAPFVNSTGTDKFVQEVRLESQESTSFEWAFGGIYSKETTSNRQKLSGQPVDFVVLDINFPSELVEYAAFGNLTYYVTEKFDVTAGVRVGRVETSVETIDGPNLIVTSNPPVFHNATHDTYSLSARYRPTDDLSLYIRAANGYRPATAALPIAGFPPVVEADTLWSYEIGAKGKAQDGLISYDFSLWYLNWRNLQASVFFQGASSTANANSDVTAYGLEGSIVLRPLDGLEFISNFAYTNSTLDSDETYAFGALAGENMPGLPKWTASIRANYDFPLGQGMDGFVGGGLRYVGARDSGFEGGIGADGTQINPLILNLPQEDYVMADVRAGVVWDNVTLSLYAKNLFNTYTYISGTARPGVGGAFRATVSVAEPRSVGAMIKLDF